MVVETRISVDGVRYTEAQFQAYFDGLEQQALAKPLS